MQRKATLLFSLLFLLGISNLFGQTSATTDLPLENKTLLNLSDENWSFYVDEESRTYYIDFETIKVNLSDIIVKNESGEVIFKEDVLDLPVNTIYEIDFTPYGVGNYAIELRTFTDFFEKKVEIK